MKEPEPQREQEQEQKQEREQQDLRSASAKPRRRRRVGVIAGCAVLLAAVLGGTGFTVVTVRDAAHDPGAPVWDVPEKAKERPSARPAATGLKGMLLPYGTGTGGYGPGPDLGEFGSDAELSGARATALRKQSLRGLPRSARRQLEKQIDKQHIKGMAMRSYLSVRGAAGLDDDRAFTMEIVLSQLGSRRTARSLAGYQQEFFDALKVLRQGPRIEGHDNARCFLPPANPKEKLDLMVCSSYVDDVQVTATAYAVGPIDKKGVANMLRAQLDRIKEPGAAT
ncbi:hypothetical protein [Streptomyces naganishii]|uniref:Secreted protein n=1 Tax=Streptomyces naganishii JCM 4654 TaxID=1306179 RepID=A0A918YBE8_9ACTN|nr:hypothetical protein [Streptomyces naganishii]GHD96697.1 hypothetical protein GCM10010508_66410 [Streptomyces naganishii JCM 4654]